MFCATITITDITQKARSLLDLLQNGSGSGYTVKTAVTWSALTTLGGVAYVSLQSSYSNANGSIVYEGDEGVKNDGSCQGKEFQPGDTDVHQAYTMTDHLSQIYITGSVNGLKINVQISYS